MTRIGQALGLACCTLIFVYVASPVMAINAAHILRALSHAQILRLQQGVERLARSGSVVGSMSLRVPPLRMADTDTAQVARAVSASWDDATARRYGAALAAAARSHGINVLTVPADAFSNSPWLAARTLTATVRGIQSGHVVAAVLPRTGGAINERLLHENDWAPIEYAIEAANPGAITCRSRAGKTATLCRNRSAFATMLTREAHFSGFGIDTRASMLTSIDRIIGVMAHVGILGTRGPRGTPKDATVTISPNALDNIAGNATVLLKNDVSVLPLATTLHTVALIGASDPIASAIRMRIPQASISNVALTDPSVMNVAQTSDAVIIVLGESVAPNEAGIVQAIGSINPKTVVVFDRAPQGSDAALLSIEHVWSPAVQPTPMPSRPSRRRGSQTPSPPPPPVDHAPALLLTWGLAQSAPGRIAEQLFGSSSPSGHLPQPVGPFPFGAGLTYTTFGVGGLKVNYGRGSAAPVTVSFTVKNTGEHTGTTVEQLYLRFPGASKSIRPVLVAATRLALAAGHAKRFALPLSVRSFAYWSTSYHAWFVAPGTYHAIVGTSSEDPQAAGDIHITSR